MGGVRAAGYRSPHRRDDLRPAQRAEPAGPAPDPRHSAHPGPRRARAAGSLIHLLLGQGFALGYAATFALLGQATWWLGGLLGLLHGAVALTVLIPLLVSVHPRMASERAGPDSRAVLEPPGILALNYGTQTPLVALVAHVTYGTALGVLLGAR